MSKDPNYEMKKRWRINNPEKCKETSRKWRLNHPEKWKEIYDRWNQRHPKRDSGNRKRTCEKIRAHNYVQTHPELLGKQCEFCSQTEKLTAHHPDYEYPEIIVTCCRRCHVWMDIGEN